MADILDKIVAYKKEEVAFTKKKKDLKELKNSKFFHKPKLSMSQSVKESNNGLITEFKRKSPSKQNINLEISVDKVVGGYVENNVAGISVLTDTHFFGGSLADLDKARKFNIPILRKDFMIDEFQFYEAKAHGADTVLLIAAVLDKYQLQDFTDLAHGVDLEVLVEYHGGEEFDYIPQKADMIGINNRNLKTFEVNIQHAIQMRSKLPFDQICIAESGINSVEAYLELKKNNFQGFLMGEYFMKNENPGKACNNFIQQIS